MSLTTIISDGELRIYAAVERAIARNDWVPPKPKPIPKISISDNVIHDAFHHAIKINQPYISNPFLWEQPRALQQKSQPNLLNSIGASFGGVAAALFAR